MATLRRIIEQVGDTCMILLGLAVFVVALWVILSFFSGCAAPGARQGTAEVDVSPIVEAVAELQATVEAEASATAALMADQSRRVVESVQANRDARIDQSTSDRWLNRGLMAGLVGIAVLVIVRYTYPAGKRRWLLTQQNGCAEPPNSVARSPP